MYDAFTQCVCAYYMCVFNPLMTTLARFLQHQSPIRKNEEKITEKPMRIRCPI